MEVPFRSGNKMNKTTVYISIFILLSAGSVMASKFIDSNHVHGIDSVTSHSGRTNSEGCHNDYKNDSYHCH